MNNLDLQYQNLLRDIIESGVEKDTRNAKTISVFGRQIRHNLNNGFPLLTTKKMAVKSIMTELKWFLKGRTDINYLRENNCKIWDGDYIASGRTDGDLGPIYGYQWRNWNSIGANGDQLANLIHELKDNPDSRRLMVNTWNVEQLDDMVLPPCHYGFQVYTQMNKSGDRYISLLWNQRSVDTFLGLPFNIASYAMLLHLIAREVDMIPGEIIGNLGDTHLYIDHIGQAKEQIERTPFDLPNINILQSNLLDGEFEYEITHYQSHPTIKAKLFN
jgi:thymidylate synthase